MRPEEELLRWLVVAMIALFLGGVAFAGTATLLHLRRRKQQEREAALEARWTAVLNDVLAGDAAPDALLGLVGARERRAFVRYLVEYATRLRGEELAIVRTLAHRVLPDIAANLQHVSPGRRAADVRALIILGMPKYEGEAIAALRDPSSLVAATAVQALCRQEYADHAQRVIEQLPRFYTWSSRFLGLLLARFGAPASAPLRDLLAREGPVSLRIAAAYALWRIGDAESAGVAEQALSGGVEDVQLIVACLRLLERVGNDTHADVVRSMMTHESGNVRAAAVSALVAVGAPKDANALRGALADPSPWVGLRAAAGLARTDRKSLQLAAAETEAMWAAIAREALAEP